MAKAQLERWALEHPTAPRTGRFFEVPFSYVGPRVAAGIAMAGVLWWVNGALFYTYKPESLSPEFMQEVHKIGPVSVSTRCAGRSDLAHDVQTQGEGTWQMDHCPSWHATGLPHVCC